MIFENSTQVGRFRSVGLSISYIAIPGILTGVFLWASSFCNAQSGYSRIYDLEQSMTLMDVKPFGQDLILYGIILPPNDSLWNAFVARVDTNGNILKWTQIRDSTAHIGNVYGSLSISVQENQFVTVPLEFVGKSAIGVAKFDSNLNIEFKTSYEFAENSVMVIYDVINAPGDNYLMTGWAQTSGTSDVKSFVLKASETGNQSWFKYYGSTQKKERTLKIEYINSNECLLSGTSDHKSYIFAIDSLGNQKWSWNDPDTIDTVARGLHRDSNGDYVYLAVHERISTHPLQYTVSVPIFIRRDSSFQLKTYKKILPYALRYQLFNMIRSRDGGWIAVGSGTNITDAGPSPPESVYGKVMKLDPDGDVVWVAQDTGYFNPELNISESELVNVIESSTGSLYAVGKDRHKNADGISREYGWLLKITADGCVDTICTTTSLYDQIYGKEHSVLVYPNPASEYLTVNVDEGMDDCRASFFDINGRLVLSREVYPGENIIALPDGLPSGIYIWRVTEEDGTVVGVGKVVVSG